MRQAARGLIDSVADVSGGHPRRTADVRLAADSDADLLAAILDEVIYRMDAHGDIPVAVAVRPDRGEETGAGPDGRPAPVRLELALAPLDDVEIIGAAPKAVSLHELRCSPDAAGRWSASVTVDV